MPIVSNFKYIKWDDWPSNLVRIETPRDGSCFFHCVLNSSFYPYYIEKIDNNYVSRSDLVKDFRKDLSVLLPEYYYKLGNGNYPEFSKYEKNFSLEKMVIRLASKKHIGHGFLEFFGKALNIDIYILSGKEKDIYRTYEYELSIKGKRPSIVIFYKNQHYELVALYDKKNNKFISYFNENNEFIKFLSSKI